ncbi:hypothetical protein AVEN_121537-1 [Araneus ventricosus]|uniref:Uncharacterized protein n=1 Tax=Araneus ventricosus TaxID=182803 RepID=A0A4Y2GPB2_ARAVE|nr:hypothetical protein AVEN_121537-1 [Araneus ventricosus]
MVSLASSPCWSSRVHLLQRLLLLKIWVQGPHPPRSTSPDGPLASRSIIRSTWAAAVAAAKIRGPLVHISPYQVQMVLASRSVSTLPRAAAAVEDPSTVIQMVLGFQVCVLHPLYLLPFH